VTTVLTSAIEEKQYSMQLTAPCTTVSLVITLVPNHRQTHKYFPLLPGHSAIVTEVYQQSLSSPSRYTSTPIQQPQDTMWYHVSEPNSYLAVTGVGIDNVRITKKCFVMPFQKVTKISITPFDFSMALQAMTSEKLQFSRES
jgi:hypothetical protein